jgi:K+-sensing histidine kinase KdpD
MGVEPIKKCYENLKIRNVSVKWITEITEDNLSYCKALMQYAEVRHLDRIKGNFGVSDSVYIATATVNKAQPVPELIYSTAKSVVEQNKNVFDTLWSKAILAEDRIKEIEEGLTRPEIRAVKDPQETKTFIDIIQNPFEIQKRYQALVASAREHILLFLPTTTAYRREEKIGIFESLEDAVARGANIRILLPTDKEIEEKIQQKLKIKKGFEIRKIKTTDTTEARSKILIVDNSTYLMVELKDNTKETFVEAVGSAIISNSKSTILSYITVFDSLWIQAELYEKLEAHDRMQKEFINIAAHELRTPVQAILGYSELLQNVSGEFAAEMLKSLTRNAYRLQLLITDILDVARIESGSLIIEKEKLNLTDLISTAIGDAENQVKVSGKQIEISYSHKQMLEAQKEKEDVIVEADRERILQVVSNLLGNALKFTNQGSIEVTTEKSQNEVIVQVRDSGSGIDLEIFPKLFEKFVTKSDKGTGLGLFISKNIIEAHGGGIWAENNSDGPGATFVFSLPAAG